MAGSLLQILLWPVYSLVRWLFDSVRNSWWRITGTREMLNKISRGERYDLSAHVLSVVGCFKLDGMASANFLEDFLLVHDRFQHPDCVFSDDVSLNKITPTHLIFVQCPGSLFVWDVKTFPFSRLGQHKGAEKVITVPRELILRWLRKVGTPTAIGNASFSLE